MACFISRKMQRGGEQDRHSGKPASQSEPDDRRRSWRKTGPPGEKRDVNRNRRNDHRRETGGNVLLGERDAAVSAQQKTTADDQSRAPIRERFLRRTLPARDRIHDYASEEKTRARHEERRNCFNRKSNGEIGRAPDNVKRRECGNDEKRAALRHAPALWHSLAALSGDQSIDEQKQHRADDRHD